MNEDAKFLEIMQENFKSLHRRMDGFETDMKSLTEKNSQESADLQYIRAKLEYQDHMGPKLAALEERVAKIELENAKESGSMTVTMRFALWAGGIIAAICATAGGAALIWTVTTLAKAAAKP